MGTRVFGLYKTVQFQQINNKIMTQENLSTSEARAYCRLNQKADFEEFVKRHKIPHRIGNRASKGLRRYFRKAALDEAIIKEEKISSKLTEKATN